MTSPTPGTGRFWDADHALITGMVAGLAKRYGLDLEPVLDADGNYLPRFELKARELPENVHVFINVEPPVTKSGGK